MSVIVFISVSPVSAALKNKFERERERERESSRFQLHSALV